ncbi:hypothetical protein Egran_05843 [Elaphomyces granulatus]|uniref:Uncharacterized protein n=1 Tax=Elaphomyces granulatus TaxID=519963 RepID=A0A232LQI4_9EURO|nr:hypothetical protein Egran_05843 [Elaphomyces granulatus]
MACPIAITKFVGTVSLGLLTGLSYSVANIAIPSLKLLPTASQASRSLRDVKRRTRKHTFQLASVSSGCFLFAWMISSKRRKHPYLLWVCVTSILGSFGVDFWFYRKKGLASWSGMVVHDVGVPALKKRKTSTKEEDVVVVETEGEVNGEIVERDMERECKLQRVRTWCSGVALTMSIVGLWGDRA